MNTTDANKMYEIGRQGDEQRFRSLIQDALSEGNEAVTSWLLDKVKAAHEGSFKDIIEEAVTNANTESETYKPTDLAKKYWNKYFPEAEQQDLAGTQQAINDALVKEPEDDDHFGEEQAAGLAELTPDNTENLYMSPEELSKRREEDKTRWAETDFKAGSPEHLAYIEKQNPGTLEKWASNKMKEAAEHLRGSNEHFGEQQAEGLDNLLEGLRDTPHDNRW